MRFELAGSGEVTVAEDLPDGIVVRYRLAPRDGSLAVAGLEVSAGATSRITASALRSMSPASAIREGMRFLKSLASNAQGGWPAWGTLMDALAPGAGWPDPALWRRVTGPGAAPQLTRAERLALVSVAYVETLASGDRKVNAAIAARFGVTVGQARELVRAARAAGMLTHPPALAGKRRGRVEGELTARAEIVLGQIRRDWLGTAPE